MNLVKTKSLSLLSKPAILKLSINPLLLVILAIPLTKIVPYVQRNIVVNASMMGTSHQSAISLGKTSVTIVESSAMIMMNVQVRQEIKDQTIEQVRTPAPTKKPNARCKTLKIMLMLGHPITHKPITPLWAAMLW